jgi:predicted DNA-binding transcriptional regulator AlpA
MTRYETRTHRMWQAHEDVLLQEAWQGNTTPREVARKLGRTVWSVTIRMHRLFGKRSGSLMPSDYSVADLAEALGVEVTNVHSYINAGLKHYKRANTSYVSRENLLEWLSAGNWKRKFVPTTSDMKELLKDAEHKWVFQQNRRYLTRTEIAKATGLSYQTISLWANQAGKFPLPRKIESRVHLYDIDEVLEWSKAKNLHMLITMYLSVRGR